ncbi:MAG: dihydrofolate reductase [Planctomycetes bacterium]|nr:dihydrofolate reductase [Planctomycetota bacterium]
MRKVQLFIATSLDGYIAGPRGEIDWLFSDQDYGYRRFLAGIDVVLMGRKSYELCLTFPQWPYPGRRCVVFTHAPARYKDARVEFTSRSPAALVRRLRRSHGKNLWLMGGGELVKHFANARLIDEAMIAVHPLVLGGGLALFPAGTRRLALRFVRARAYNSGLVMLSYRK